MADRGFPATSSNEDRQATKHTAAQLSEARKQLTKAAKYYPLAEEGEAGFTIDLTDQLRDGTLFTKLRCQKVTAGSGAKKTESVQFQRGWWQPFVWALSQLRWSNAHHADDPLPRKRATSVSYVELACGIDVLTGGAFGPQHASYQLKAALAKYALGEIQRSAGRKYKVAGIELRKLLVHMGNTNATAAAGFPMLPGINRRPRFSEHRGVAGAVGTLIFYAKARQEKLAALMPRYPWVAVQWRPDWLALTWADITAKRQRGPDELRLDLKPRDARLAKDSSSVKRARTGPCAFGCSTSTQTKNSKTVWMAVPNPSPWSTVLPGESLCRKCYDRAQRTAKRSRHATALRRREDLQDAGEPAQLSRRLSSKTSLAAALAAEASSEAMHAGQVDAHMQGLDMRA
jgi:hypothetical protein